MVIFDTSLLVDAARKKKEVRNLIESYSKNERIATTVINKYELLRGVPEKEVGLVSEWLSQFVIYEFEETALRETITAYKKLARKGKMVSELDVLIAGITVANDEVLVTRDKDFLNFGDPKIVVL
ncbi:MAG TPA: type II toxin-antitoxin system VapC family toxin [Candidatus Limnocylindrales bacterium]|nr:type II toxin-antitoxin system VapC family toxin [Candidatus Limnocylindrales bacterium]